MSNQDDTQQFNVPASFLSEQAPLSDQVDLSEVADNHIVDLVAEHAPSPAAIRAVALALASLVAASIGKDVNITPVLDAALTVYTLVVPFGLSIWFGKKVKSAKAVVSATKP
jgi:hypothetical protein